MRYRPNLPEEERKRLQVKSRLQLGKQDTVLNMHSQELLCAVTAEHFISGVYGVNREKKGQSGDVLVVLITVPDIVKNHQLYMKSRCSVQYSQQSTR